MLEPSRRRSVLERRAARALSAFGVGGGGGGGGGGRECVMGEWIIQCGTPTLAPLVCCDRSSMVSFLAGPVS